MPICANTWCRSSFEIHPEELQFLRKIGFTFGNTVIHPPSPTLCPDCRLQQRTAHRNERFLYRNRSSLSGREMVALYADSAPWGPPYTIYAQDEWRSDRWDPMSFGRTFDPHRPFFEQWSELHKAVPRMGLIQISNENCDYTTGTGYCRNCYLINSSEYCEDCFYGKLIQHCKDCVDCSYLFESELCSECFSVYNSYGCTSVSFSKNCQECHFSSYLTGCKHCILCTNLTQKEYHVENRPVSREEYQSILNSFQGSWSKREEMKTRLRSLEATHPKKFANIVNCEACMGDYLENSKNCTDCYDLTDSQDCRYVHVGINVKDNIDCSNMYWKIELCYQVLGAIEAYGCAYCLFVFHSQRLLYCEYCFHCSDCFGCNGLQHKQYCIFNKQYTKEQYEERVPKIIEHMKHTSLRSPSGSYAGQACEWGLYFPSTLAPFAYNETLASEYFPLTKDEALVRGFHWRDVKDEIPKVQKVIPAERLPDQLSDTPDDVLNWAITCEASTRPFRIQKPELAFYRKRNLPIPRKHPDVRYDERLALRNPRRLWSRTCAKCRQEVLTTYAPDRPEKVLCEACYLKEVY